MQACSRGDPDSTDSWQEFSLSCLKCCDWQAQAWPVLQSTRHLFRNEMFRGSKSTGQLAWEVQQVQGYWDQGGAGDFHDGLQASPEVCKGTWEARFCEPTQVLYVRMSHHGEVVDDGEQSAARKGRPGLWAANAREWACSLGPRGVSLGDSNALTLCEKEKKSDPLYVADEWGNDEVGVKYLNMESLE